MGGSKLALVDAVGAVVEARPSINTAVDQCIQIDAVAVWLAAVARQPHTDASQGAPQNQVGRGLESLTFFDPRVVIGDCAPVDTVPAGVAVPLGMVPTGRCGLEEEAPGDQRNIDDLA